MLLFGSLLVPLYAIGVLSVILEMMKFDRHRNSYLVRIFSSALCFGLVSIVAYSRRDAIQDTVLYCLLNIVTHAFLPIFVMYSPL